MKINPRITNQVRQDLKKPAIKATTIWAMEMLGIPTSEEVSKLGEKAWKKEPAPWREPPVFPTQDAAAKKIKHAKTAIKKAKA